MKYLTYQKNSDSGASGAGGAGLTTGGIGGINIPPIDADGGLASSMVEVSAKVQEFADKFKSIMSGIGGFLSENKVGIIASLAGISAGIGTYLIGVNWGCYCRCG